MLVSLVVLLVISIVQGDSPPAPPIRKYDFATCVGFSQGSFGELHLEFSAFNRTFRLVLTPHHALVAPHAVVEIVGDGGTEVFPIAQSNAFKGEVYEKNNLFDAPSGWARVMITNASSDSPLSIDGSFKTCI
jgi:hypothetical protein